MKQMLKNHVSLYIVCIAIIIFFSLSFHMLASEELYSEFLKSHTCYDLIPESTKVVVFDTKLKVGLK